MSEASPAGSDGNRRARIAAQRAAQQRAGRRNRLLAAIVAIVVVVAVVLGLVLARGSGSGSGTASGVSTAPGPTGAALAALVNQVTSVPASTMDQVGGGQASAPPSTISGTALTSGGKPEMLYIGAEYCPFCAAERWAMVVALSRFGTLKGLTTIRSAAHDGSGTAEPYPSTPTFSFAGASFASAYLTFTPVEEYTNIPDPKTGFYTSLRPLTAQQQALLTKYDSADQGSIPFIDFGNKYVSIGASYNPAVLGALTWQQIGANLHNPSSPVATSVLGAANYLTAAICGITGDQPASACTPAVKALQAKI